jgi:arabinogalactan endo-1,4-beta-galactosidase
VKRKEVLKACFYFLILVLCANNITICAQNFYFGNDLSYIREMEDCGAGYKENGLAKDPYAIIKDHGGNLVRLRLWHTPSWYDALNLGNRYSDLNDVILSSYRAKSLGLQVLLDFHLSDTWADPTHQVVPAAWAPVVNNLPVLQDSLYNYIHTTLTILHQAGLLPEIVQIGNETNKGILLSQQVNDQGWSVDWNRNAALFNTAIDAIRDVETETGSAIKIALHIADPSELNWWFDQFWTHGVQDFNIIGMSYYHQYHQDLLPAVGEVISNMKSTYPGKEVMILETAYPWTSDFNDGANNLLYQVYPFYPFSPAKQKQWMIDLTQTVIDHGGSGVVYWEPGWVSTDCYTQYGKGSNWENCTFFDFENNVFENGGIGWMEHVYNFGTGINEVDKESNVFQVVPDGNKIWIYEKETTSLTDRISVEIFALDGKRIWKEEMELVGGKGALGMEKGNYPRGVYYFRVTRKGEMPNNLLVLF